MLEAVKTFGLILAELLILFTVISILVALINRRFGAGRIQRRMGRFRARLISLRRRRKLRIANDPVGPNVTILEQFGPSIELTVLASICENQRAYSGSEPSFKSALE